MRSTVASARGTEGDTPLPIPVRRGAHEQGQRGGFQEGPDGEEDEEGGKADPGETEPDVAGFGLLQEGPAKGGSGAEVTPHGHGVLVFEPPLDLPDAVHEAHLEPRGHSSICA